MYCSVCGATYADGQPACPNCGAPAQPANQMGGFQQPMGQPMNPGRTPMGQPMNPGMAPMGQPMNPGMTPMGQPMNPGMAPVGGMGAPVNNGGGFQGFFNAIKSDYNIIFGLVGGLLIFLSPFFTWFSAKIEMWGYKESMKENMFKLGKEYSDVRIYYLWSILLFLVGVVIICWDLADYIPELGKIKASLQKVPYVDLIIVGVGVLVVIFALMNGTVKDVISDVKDFDGKASHGIGPVIAFIGLILSAYPRVIKFIKK